VFEITRATDRSKNKTHKKVYIYPTGRPKLKIPSPSKLPHHNHILHLYSLPTTHNYLVAMPLDTSTYFLALLRLDGRRWNELRRLTAQISTQAAADGSSYLEMGNTKVICTVEGPSEPKAGRGGGGNGDEATVSVEISIAGFSGVDRKRRGRNDKYVCNFFLTSIARRDFCFWD
jgi:hypothetical protein